MQNRKAEYWQRKGNKDRKREESRIISLFYGLIDEVCFLVYNSRMEQKGTQIVYTERNAPKRAIVRSDGVLYVLLLLLVFTAIGLSHVLAKQFGINRLYVQLVLYVVLLGVGYAIYRLRLIDYLYELTDRELIVTQAVGSKQKQIARIPFNAIEKIGPFAPSGAKTTLRTYRGKKTDATAIWYTEGETRHVTLLNASDELKRRLTEAIHAQQ